VEDTCPQGAWGPLRKPYQTPW